MTQYDPETLKKLLASREPAISESLAGEVMRDIDAALAPRPFNARVHCTKLSRSRATLWGLLLGASLGLLIGVTLTWVLPGLGGRQIVYVEAPVPPSVEPQTPDRPEPRRESGHGDAMIARAERTVVPMSEIDRLIEETLEQRRKINIPEYAGGQYVDRRFVPPDTFRPDQSLTLLKRELLETYQ